MTLDSPLERQGRHSHAGAWEREKTFFSKTLRIKRRAFFNMNVPKLRFKEFSGEWEKKTLGNILTFKNGVNASREQYGSGYKFINVLDIINNSSISYENIIGSVNISEAEFIKNEVCLLYTSPSPRDGLLSRMPSSA